MMVAKLGDIMAGALGVPRPSPEAGDTCKRFRKTIHKSEGAAQAALRSLVRRGLDRPEDGELYCFPCGHCNGWHTGHRGRRVE